MVQTDQSRIGTECRQWIDALRSLRAELNDSRDRLRQAISGPMQKDLLPQVEHFENQFDIQLTNINHLKHSIKDHEKEAEWSADKHPGKPAEHILNGHENLHDQFRLLEDSVSELLDAFGGFMRSVDRT